MKFLGNVFKIVCPKLDVVADKQGRGGKAGHCLDADFSANKIEEKVVALAALVKVFHQVVDGSLYVVSKHMDVFVVVGYDIEL